MELNRKRLRSRPTLVKQEKIGIAIMVLIAMIDAVAIYYFISLYDLPSHGFLVSLSGWMQDHIICSDSWIKASIRYTDRVHFIYLVAVCSIVLSCFVVLATTPRGQLLQWSKDADARHILFHLFVYVIGLLSIMCFVGNSFAIGDMREHSRFLFLFNSYIGLVLLVCVAVNVFTYYATLSLLLFYRSVKS